MNEGFMQNPRTFRTGCLLATAGIVVVAFKARPAHAPTTDTKSPAFEVASVKPSDPNARGQFRYLPGGTVVIRGVTLPLLIQQAYDVKDFQISGGPAWMPSKRYDITAKTGDVANASPTDPARMRLRLQALLADRFHLQLHRESKELSVYTLVMAKNGPKLKEDQAADPAGRMFRGIGQLKGEQVDMRFLSVWLARLVGRPVGDQTGLKGTYDFELNWVPDSSQGRLSGPEPGAGSERGLTPADQNSPSIFTAIQEQLGLKLEPRKGPVEILVIDHMEQPTPD
jgi:bla regulator protein BlaR1